MPVRVVYSVFIVILMMLNTISVSLCEMICCSVGLSCIAQMAGVNDVQETRRETIA
jgi:hypothetical protein